MVNRYPNTATLIYVTQPTLNTLGYPVAGTTNSLSVYCAMQPNNAGLTVSQDGTERRYQYDMITPLITASIPSTAVLKVRYSEQEMPVLQRFTWQYHEELKVG